MQEEISLKDLFDIVKKHVFTIFALTLIGAILSLVFMNFFVEPKYQSEAQLLVNQKSTEQQTIIVAFSLYSATIRFFADYKDNQRKLKKLYRTIISFVFISGVISLILSLVFRNKVVNIFFEGIGYTVL